MKKQLLFLALMLSVATSAFAVQVEIDGLWYKLVSKAKEAKVIQYKNNNYYSGNIVIPATVEYEGVNYTVTSIGVSAFRGCSGLISITIPNSVTSIDKYAFNNCNGLTSVHISDLETWCKIAFSKYDSNPLFYAHHLFLNGEEIKNLIIPNNVTSIGRDAFSGCSSLTSVTIGNGVTSIEDWAFRGCSGLTSVTIPNSVTSIGEGAFSGCSGLSSFTIPNSVTTIGSYTFHYCSGLTSITIPNSVTSIGEGAFYRCSGLTSVTIPNSVTSIGEGAFYRCSGLTSIMIPNSVTSIGDQAFYNCSGLTSIQVETGNTAYDSRNNCNAIIEIATNTLILGSQNTSIPNSVTSIGNFAFYECSGLTSITIPNSVTSIGDYAFFYCCGLTSIIIGSGVKKINSLSFANCPELTDVYCYAKKVSSTNTYAFDGSSIENATLHVPTAFVDAYKAKDPWSNFKTIMGLDGSLSGN